MPHYYDNYGDSYYEEYPTEQYPPYPPRHPYHYPTGQVGPIQHHSRPRRRYSHSQVYDSVAPDNHYPSYITQPRQYGQQQAIMNYYSPQRPRKAVDSFPSARTSLQQRQDPIMFQDQQYQYDNHRQRRSSTGSTWASSYPTDYEDDYVTNNQNDDSDDDSLNTLEMLALENAKRNVNPSGATPSPFHPENLSIPISAQIEHNNINNEIGLRSEQDHTTNLTTSETLTDNTASNQQESTKKRRWPLSYLFRKSSTGSNFSKASYNLFMTTTPSPSNSLTTSNSSDSSNHTNDSQNRNIPPRQKQKQKQPQPSIIAYRNKLETTTPSQTDVQSRQLGDAEMTAMLDNIWCFKASESAAQLISPDNNSNVWTGFDFKNQEILTNHSFALMNDPTMTDPGLELFDSHIRKGALPFLVVISQQLAYYPTSHNTIDKIEIKCLPNTKETVLLRKKKLG